MLFEAENTRAELMTNATELKRFTHKRTLLVDNIMMMMMMMMVKKLT